MELIVFWFGPVFQFDLESLRDVEFSDLLVVSSGEGIINIVSIENLLDLLLCSDTVLRYGIFHHWSGKLIITFTKDIDSHLLLLKLLWASVVLLMVLVKFLATQVVLEILALLCVDLHLVVLLVLLGLDFLLDKAFVIGIISLQTVLLLVTDAGVFLEQIDVFVVELDRLFLFAWSPTFLLLSVPFLGLLLEEFLFDLVVTNDEFFEL